MKEAQLIVDGKTINITISNEELAKLQSPKPKKTGYERASEDGKYWAIDDSSCVEFHYDVDSTYDDKLYESANYFSDVTVAEHMARAQLLWNRIHRRAVELCEPVYMTEEKPLVVISFSKSENFVSIYPIAAYGRAFGTVFFDTKEHCQQVIDEFHDELLWYFTEFRDRADM